MDYAYAVTKGKYDQTQAINFSGGSSGQEGKQAYGVNAGFMGKGIIGAEFSFGYAPNFFGEADVKNREMDYMANLIVGIPIGGTHGGGVVLSVVGVGEWVMVNVVPS